MGLVTGPLVEETHYTPLGVRMLRISSKAAGAPQAYSLYQGKDFDEAFDLDINDFHARQYDPVLGRFLQIDPMDQFASGFTGMGNNWPNGVDPDGKWVNIAIGAAIGGFLKGVQYASDGKGFFNGFWRGALMGALGGISGYFAPIGILPGMAYGAGTGAIIGAGGALLDGNNVGRGALIGGATGGVLGGLSGGIMANKLGADIWTGYREPLANISDGGIYTGSFKKNELNYSDETLYEFNKKHFPNSPRPGGRMTIKTPRGYKNDGMFFEKDGKQALGVTVRKIWKGGSSSSIHLSKTAFHSNETMSLVMGHELGHLHFGMMTGAKGWALSADEEHWAIHSWESEAAIKNGWIRFNNQMLMHYKNNTKLFDGQIGETWMLRQLDFLPRVFKFK